MSRKASREYTMKLLYQIQIQKDEHEEQIRQFFTEQENLTEEDKRYMLDVILGVQDNLEQIDGFIKRNARGWILGRMPKVDLAIMRLSIYEMKYRTDIPYNVSINEAVELSKKYGTEQSRAFINGVLGKVVTELESGESNA